MGKEPVCETRLDDPKLIDDDRGTPDNRVKRLESLLLAEPLDPLDQEPQIGLDGTEIDVFGITWWHGEVIRGEPRARPPFRDTLGRHRRIHNSGYFSEKRQLNQWEFSK